MSRMLHSLWGRFNIRERIGAEIIKGIFKVIVAIIGLFAAYQLVPIALRQSQSASITKSPGAQTHQTQISVAGNYYGTDATGMPNNPKALLLAPQQYRLLSFIHGYQKKYGATKLVIARDGKLQFIEPGQRAISGINLATELMGNSNEAVLAREFEILIEAMPDQYLHKFQETRWGSPFVVTVTETGVSYLEGKKIP